MRPFLRAYARSPLVRRIANVAMRGSQAGGTVLASVRPGYRVADIQLPPFGYAALPQASYGVFAELKRAGVISPQVRLQVARPTPLALLIFFGAADQARLAPLFEQRMLAEVSEIVAAIPPSELAIQWDVAVEFAVLERVWPSPFGSPRQSLAPIIDMLVRIGNAVPADVELGYHLCYGDAANKHFVEPRDTTKMADVTRGIVHGLRRPLNWLHFPMPRERTDAAYLTPMLDAGLDSGTQLYVAWCIPATACAAPVPAVPTAQQVLQREFGIATECGLGRSQPGAVAATLQLHADLAAPVT